MESKKQQSQCWNFKELKKKPLVLVTWKDITSTHTGWFETTKNLETALIKSPCWILEEDDKELKLVSAVGVHKEDVFFGFDTIVPRGCVIDIKMLKKQWWN